MDRHLTRKNIRQKERRHSVTLDETHIPRITKYLFSELQPRAGRHQNGWPAFNAPAPVDLETTLENSPRYISTRSATQFRLSLAHPKARTHALDGVQGWPDNSRPDGAPAQGKRLPFLKKKTVMKRKLGEPRSCFAKHYDVETVFKSNERR